MADRTPTAVLALRIVRTYVEIRRGVSRQPVAQLVATAPRGGDSRRDGPRRLSRAVSRVLARGGEAQVRCIHRALVLHRLLARQGVEATVVIGLPQGADGIRAHAWVEVAGRDVGPSPGRAGHEPMASYR